MVSELEARVKEERRNFSVTSRCMIAGGKRKICTGKLIFAKYILSTVQTFCQRGFIWMVTSKELSDNVFKAVRQGRRPSISQ